MKEKAKAALELFKEAATGWSDDNVPTLGAALAYYTIFSIAPLLIVAIAVAGWVFGEQAARGELFNSIQSMVGANGAEAIQAMIKGASKSGSGVVATIIGVVTLLIGASSVFAQLQLAFNMIWKVAPRPGAGIKNIIRQRAFTFAMVIGIGFLLLVSLIVSAALTVVGNLVVNALPGGSAIWQVVNFVVSLGVIAALFAMMFKLLPDVELRWNDVWMGAIVTSALFTLGKFAISFYLGHGAIASTYGAVGSLVALLVWVFYSSQIVLFGTEFTRAYALKHGSHFHAKAGAMVTDLSLHRAAKEAKQASLASGSEGGVNQNS